MKIFPRKITVLFPRSIKIFNKRYIVFYLRDLLIVVLISVIGLQLLLLVSLNSRVKAERMVYLSRQEEYGYWVGVAHQFPNIPDVLYNAAVSSLKVGRRDEAISYLSKAIRLDPVFERAKLLKKKIED